MSIARLETLFSMPLGRKRESAMAHISTTSSHFHCRRCSCGDFEAGHLTQPDEPYCLVCWEEDGQQIQLERWEEVESNQARFRDALLAG
jgi:hypothetical protein